MSQVGENRGRLPGEPLLLAELAIRGVTLRNRIVVSPMCMYSAKDGRANEFHLVHVGRFALGGAGAVILEATAVESRGRISHGDLGIWNDDQADALRPIARFLSAHGAVPGIQLAHAGRRASTSAPWYGLAPLTEFDSALGRAPWPVVGPTALKAGEGWPVPDELTEDEILSSIDAWASAATRAVDAGFRIIELHGAHGYLLHSFLSPISNQRNDGWGGSPEARARYALSVVRAVRRSIPADIPIFYRLSAVDAVPGGLELPETILFARDLVKAGVDLVDVSSGGIVADGAASATTERSIRRGYSFHAPFSAKIRDGLDEGLVGTVGLIVSGPQAESILRAGQADVINVGREFLNDPNWGHHAAEQLRGRDYAHWAPQSGWWLNKRRGLLERLEAQGADPVRGLDQVGRNIHE